MAKKKKQQHHHHAKGASGSYLSAGASTDSGSAALGAGASSGTQASHSSQAVAPPARPVQGAVKTASLLERASAALAKAKGVVVQAETINPATMHEAARDQAVLAEQDFKAALAITKEHTEQLKQDCAALESDRTDLKDKATELQAREEEIDAMQAALDESTVQQAADKVVHTSQCNAQTSAIAAERARLDADQRSLQLRARELDVRERDLNVRHTSLIEREARAEADFAPWKQAHLQALDDERNASRDSLDAEREAQRIDLEAERTLAREEMSSLRARRASLEAEMQERRSLAEIELSSDLTARRSKLLDEARVAGEALHADQEQALRDRDAQIVARLAALEAKEREVDTQSRAQQLAEAALDDRVERQVADLRAGFIADARRAQEASERSQARADELQERLRELDAALDGQTADQVIQLDRDCKTLRKQIKQVEKERDALPTQAERQQLEQLRAERDGLLRELAGSNQNLVVARTERNNLRIEHATSETVRRERDVLRAQASAYEQHVRKLEKKVGELSERGDKHQVFPGCTHIAEEAETVSIHTAQSKIDKLGDFAAGVRNAMASAESPRYYNERQVRTVLACIASSRLLLLEGLSGTGKTSLPKALASAIGAGCEVVEVQAGWRDRNDLLGHYNSFEDRFEETPFLQALVKAAQPAYADRPFFIVLDEMNLSYVEHYFADFLSKLGSEDEAADNPIKIVGRPLTRLPTGLQVQDGSTVLPLPPNVIFVGTANQDETTKGFADKTYDRAMVIRLEKRGESFKAKSPKLSLEVDLETVELSFEAAQKRYHVEAETLHGLLEDRLRAPLDDLEIGWGNRFHAQFLDFVPVAMATGGDAAEALDHLIATRLFRKLVKRFDLRSDKLDELRAALQRLRQEPLISVSVVGFPEAERILERAYEEACEREGKTVGALR